MRLCKYLKVDISSGAYKSASTAVAGNSRSLFSFPRPVWKMNILSFLVLKTELICGISIFQYTWIL